MIPQHSRPLKALPWKYKVVSIGSNSSMMKWSTISVHRMYRQAEIWSGKRMILAASVVVPSDWGPHSWFRTNPPYPGESSVFEVGYRTNTQGHLFSRLQLNLSPGCFLAPAASFLLDESDGVSTPTIAHTASYTRPCSSPLHKMYTSKCSAVSIPEVGFKYGKGMRINNRSRF